MPATIPYSHSWQAHRCPDCGEPIVRVSRRAVDRLQSLVSPVWRFCCSDPDCSWTATIRREELRIPLFS